MSLVSILQHTGHEFQQNGCEVLQQMLFCPREQQGITATETPVQFYCIQLSTMMLNKHWQNKTNQKKGRGFGGLTSNGQEYKLLLFPFVKKVQNASTSPTLALIHMKTQGIS